MTVSRRDFLRFSSLTAAAAAVSWSGTRLVAASPAAGVTGAGEVDAGMLHVLRRLTWGVRPQDLTQIQLMGIEDYIDWQLQPETIPDTTIDEFMGGRRMLAMSYSDLVVVASRDYEKVLQAVLWARVYRAAYSERQLYELMVEFWTDHFNIPIGDYLAEKTVDDRDVIRAHAMGSFRDLLFASARSIAMLQYLDNASSDREHPNENYAREVMELHTLGVDGGYTEQDVKEVARALTGWTVDKGAFVFNSDMHDDGEKIVLGTRLAAGRGIEDGLQVLDLLATHPATARFISLKLIRRFVSDFPPVSLIESTAQVFSASAGDVRQVLRHIFISAEFRAAPGQKFQRPLDLLVAMMRALDPGLQIQNPLPLIYALEPMGQIPFYWHPPNGYPDAAGAWINTNGLLHRWNLGMNLALAGEGYFDGASLNLQMLLPIPATIGELVDSAIQRILGGQIADHDRTQLLDFMGGSADDALTQDLYYDRLPGLLGLLMASPYFQWR